MVVDKEKLFIEKANKVHNNQYDYSKVEYIDSKTKVCIICQEHGEFWQTPSAHIRGNKCPKCANMNRGKIKRFTKNEFMERARKVHGYKYDYYKAKYVNMMTSVTIVCPEHGDFEQTPNAHLHGQGCPKCKGRNLSQHEIIEKFIQVHGNKYNYSKVEFNRMHDKVCIICPEHGEFWQTPSKHLLGQGCKQCGYESNKGGKVSMWDFLERSKIVHGNKYDYSEVYFNTVHDKIKIKCKKHGYFYQNVYDHLNGHGCPRCGIVVSKDEEEIYNMLSNKLGDDLVEQRNRNILGDGKEIDIYIPSIGIGIEYNGLKWHCEDNFKGRDYHLNKTEMCNKVGVRLIHIFEDEYKTHIDVINRMLCDVADINLSLPIVNSYECNIKEIRHEIGRQFIERNSIFGNSKSTVYIGAFYKFVLVGVMSFLRLDNNGNWIVSSYATDPKFDCRDVLLMIFNQFRGIYNPNTIKAYSDRRWFGQNDDIYIDFGFELYDVKKPDYKYILKESPCKRINKSVFRNSSYRRRHGIQEGLSELKAAKFLGYSRIWDCGKYVYLWKKK